MPMIWHCRVRLHNTYSCALWWQALISALSLCASYSVHTRKDSGHSRLFNPWSGWFHFGTCHILLKRGLVKIYGDPYIAKINNQH